MTERCGLDALLSAGGPVRVALRPCCLAALVGRRPGTDGDPVGADAPPLQPTGHSGQVGLTPSVAGSGLVCAAAEAELQVTS